MQAGLGGVRLQDCMIIYGASGLGHRSHLHPPAPPESHSQFQENSLKILSAIANRVRCIDKENRREVSRQRTRQRQA